MAATRSASSRDQRRHRKMPKGALLRVSTTGPDTLAAHHECLSSVFDVLVSDPQAWVAYVKANSPSDLSARLGMAEAIQRRIRSGRDLEAVVTRTGVGTYRVKSPSQREYRVAIYGLDPGRAACDCADFLRNALGICKHVACVVADRVDVRGMAGEVLQRHRDLREGATAPLPILDWSPIRPWTGADLAWARLSLRASVKGTELFWARIQDDLYRPLTDVTSPAPFSAHLLKLVSRIGAGSVSPSAMAVARELAAEIEEQKIFSANATVATRLVKRSKRALFSYQQEGVARLLYQGRLLLADDMGLGKTTQVVCAASALFEAGAIARALIVVPAALKTQWAREWQEVSDTPLVVVEGGREARTSTLRRAGSGVLLMNYEQVVRDEDAVRRWGPHLMVLDEAQRIKNWAAKTSVVMKSMTPRYRWVVTGTPFENRLDELASVVEWLDDRAMEPKWRLDCFHADRSDDTQAITGAKHLSTLRARLERCVLRRARAEVLSQLPERSDTHRAVPMTDAQRIEHDMLNRDVAALASIRKVRSLRQHEFLRLMTLLNLQRMYCNAAILPADQETWTALRSASPAAALPALGSPKLEEFRQMVRELVIGQRLKVAVFSQWRRMLKWAHWAVRDLLEEAGVSAGFFTGAEAEPRRRENVIRFHDDPDFRLLFLSDAGGVGLNLQRAAPALINLEFPWNPAVLEQRIGRIHRFGQKRPVQVFLLSSSEGIEARISGLVSNKKALFQGFFEGTDDNVAFERAGTFLTSIADVLPVDRRSKTVVGQEARDARDSELDAEPRSDVAVGNVVRETVSLSVVDDPAPTAETAETPLDLAPSMPFDKESVRRLFETLRMSRLEGGGLRIEAPPESAAMLAAVFQGMAALFSKAQK